ncbi:hypothetical protein ACIQTZ_12645, partial [Paenarthrobacter sp. NPDC090520]|uniref:hypothetical protein n=1 Tax=Paenarthrobacter sp. NPDC090520 TaxID=3364382 RepID=UPI00381B4C56
YADVYAAADDNSHADAECQPDEYPAADDNSHADAECQPDEYPAADDDGHPNPDGHADAECHADPDRYSHADPHHASIQRQPRQPGPHSVGRRTGVLGQVPGCGEAE